MTTLRGWRYTAFIGVIVGGIGLTLYPIVIHPMINTEEYSNSLTKMERKETLETERT